MVVAGIIAEYNPFHNGHMHQIRKIKEKLNPDYIIVALGNNFTERGDVSLFDKFDKTTIALMLGVDLVIEIPTVFSCSSAEYFAMAGIRLLNATGVVTHLCFGGETDNLDKLVEISTLLANETTEFKKALRDELNSGVSFPVARSNALFKTFKNDNEIKEIISMPNNILAIEYIKELIRLKSNIKPYLVKRNGPGFYSNDVKDNITSATNIRNMLLENKDVSNYVPDITNTYINKYKDNMKNFSQNFSSSHKNSVMTIDDFSDILIYKLRTMSKEELSLINEVKEGLENTIIENSKNFNTISDIITASKSKRFTYTGIFRVISYILLDITKESFKESLNAFPRYIRILGFRSNSEALLSEIVKINLAKHSKVKIITNVNKFLKENKNKYITKELEKEIKYNNIYHIKLDNKVNGDYTQKMIVI